MSRAFRALVTIVSCGLRRVMSRCHVATPTPAATRPGNGERADQRCCSAGDELRPGHDRGRGDETVDQSVDRVVGVVDAEVDADAAGPDLFEDGPQVIGQSRDEVVPAAHGASGLAGDAPRVEAHGHDLMDVRLDQLRDAHLCLHAAAEPLESQQDAEQQRQISGDHQPVLVEELHAAGDDPVHVELSDTDQQVAVEPRLDGTPQRAACRRRAVGS